MLSAPLDVVAEGVGWEVWEVVPFCWWAGLVRPWEIGVSSSNPKEPWKTISKVEVPEEYWVLKSRRAWGPQRPGCWGSCMF